MALAQLAELLAGKLLHADIGVSNARRRGGLVQPCEEVEVSVGVECHKQSVAGSRVIRVEKIEQSPARECLLRWR